MKRSTLVTLLASLAYAAVVSASYRQFLHPVYEYAGFILVDRPPWSWVATLLLCALPVLFRSSVLTATSVISTLTYVLYYVPSLWSLHHGLDRPLPETLPLELVLAACMAGLFVAARARVPPRPSTGGVDTTYLLAVTVAVLAAIAVTFRGSLRLVGFDQVYDLRFAAVELGAAPLIGYLMMWATYCLLPFALAVGIVHRRVVALTAGFGGCLIVYMATGAKSAVLCPAIMLALYALMHGRSEYFLARVAGVGAAGASVLIWLLPTEGIFLWARSLVLMRTLGNAGWTTAIYYDYFSRNGYTGYTHIGPLRGLLGSYPYGRYELGQLIGIEIAGTEAANFNAAFWGSDGMAAAGIFGLPVATLGVMVYLRALDWAAAGADRRVVALWVCGFAMALLNLPFATAMLSGGGILLLILLRIVRFRDRAHAGVFDGASLPPPARGADREASSPPTAGP